MSFAPHRVAVISLQSSIFFNILLHLLLALLATQPPHQSPTNSPFILKSVNNFFFGHIFPASFPLNGTKFQRLNIFTRIHLGLCWDGEVLHSLAQDHDTFGSMMLVDDFSGQFDPSDISVTHMTIARSYRWGLLKLGNKISLEVLHFNTSSIYL